MQFENLNDVVEWNMCIGCGACFSFCDKDAIEMVNIHDKGILPKIDLSKCKDCYKCLDFCPGVKVQSLAKPDDHRFVGNTLSIWEGYAKDKSVRYSGSSGGVVTALAQFCLEEKDYKFVVHTGMNEESPWQNETKLSHSLEELLKHSGSRYNVSSPCEALKLIENSDKPCVFIGKPCDVAAVSIYRKMNAAVDRNLGLVLSFFCAGTPTVDATKRLIKSLGFDPHEILSLKYRGEGWPGFFNIKARSGASKKITYDESWGYLSGIRPFRCNLCPDGMAELSDITCGDAWHKYDAENDGLSLVLVRSQKGQILLDEAVSKNYIEVYKSDENEVMKAQPGLYAKRRDIWGRLKAMDLLGIPRPQFPGFPLKRLWMENNFFQRLKKILGTLKRLLKKGLTKRNHFF